MEYTTVGATGMKVSRLCLGTMSFGSGRAWTRDEAESDAIIQRAIDLRVNFFDTANVYSTGESEEILGSSLDGHDRDWLVVSTKVYHRMNPENPNTEGLSRKTIHQELEHSLDRLGMNAVDIYHAHELRLYDDATAAGIETTVRAFDEVVKRGKVGYLGASSVWAWELATALAAADRLGAEPFTVVQNHYNLAFARRSGTSSRCVTDTISGSSPTAPWRGGISHVRMAETRRPREGRTRRSITTTRSISAAAGRPTGASRSSPRIATSRWRKSPSPGCSTRSGSMRRLSGCRASSNSRTRSRRWTCNSPTAT